MSESDWILPVLGIGGLAIGGLLVLPSFMKSREEESMGPIESQGYDALDRELEARRKLAELRELRDREVREPSYSNRIPLMIGQPYDDDAYVITDEDFDKLDIGKKDRRFLNKQRKLKDARLERVVYGDNGLMPIVPSYFVNTVSPYGQGPSYEFTRLVGPQDNSNTNTRTNTINLY